MKSYSWVTFALNTTSTSTRIHLFPSAQSVTAPYPCGCTIALFGNGLDLTRVSLDGLRMSQPDGLLLEDAFPFLREGSGGIYGLGIEVHTNQPRVELMGSSCVVELAGQSPTVQFEASPYVLRDSADQWGQISQQLSGNASLSILSVNASESEMVPHIQILQQSSMARAANDSEDNLYGCAVLDGNPCAPWSTRETKISSRYIEDEVITLHTKRSMPGQHIYLLARDPDRNHIRGVLPV